jgi:catechol 2,3-dioxygenase-like lactoylglutathione lyase family enzyme
MNLCKKAILGVWTSIALCVPGLALGQTDAPVQSLLLRAVITTCKLGESIAFYRDILGQKVIQERDFTSDVIDRYTAVSEAGSVRLVVMEGRGEYPGGPIAGGRIAFMGILDDPDGPGCRDMDKKKSRPGHHGDPVLPFRVGNIDEIHRRLVEKGYEVSFPPTRSPVGLSRNMIAFDPNGVLLELFELNIAPLADPIDGVFERMPIR